MPPPTEIRQRVQRRLREQRALVRALLSARELLAGSVFVRYGRCGKPNCRCRAGRGHGPYYVLSARSGGSGSFGYLQAGTARRARDWVRRQRRFRLGLRRLDALNTQLVELLRRHQERQLAQTLKRLGWGERSRQKTKV